MFKAYGYFLIFILAFICLAEIFFYSTQMKRHYRELLGVKKSYGLFSFYAFFKTLKLLCVIALSGFVMEFIFSGFRIGHMQLEYAVMTTLLVWAVLCTSAFKVYFKEN